MTELLKTIDYILTGTEEEAESMVASIKSSSSYTVTGYSITKKVKKDSEYFILKITKEFATEKDIV
jgi:hypothetical protein